MPTQYHNPPLLEERRAWAVFSRVPWKSAIDLKWLSGGGEVEYDKWVAPRYCRTVRVFKSKRAAHIYRDEEELWTYPDFIKGRAYHKLPIREVLVRNICSEDSGEMYVQEVFVPSSRPISSTAFAGWLIPLVAVVAVVAFLVLVTLTN